ncbi:alpha/beta hydrolase [Nocardioides panacisoli]|uniref:alpha/beta hydrolase n=1 Tax=Nocardioides panacisoli TaxID=627624 RepID=UPI001C62BAD1|nr:alpha/beta hydrolase [Nocardioides panacisoli]QYJ05014.1 alpha/beta hydrolase [Nocardioides panacisoli]
MPGTQADVLGAPWVADTLELAPDDEGEAVATLVHRGRRRHDAAMLHVHGFSDYFFHTEYAAWWLERGFDPFGLDLRKYGRSLRPHQTPTYVDDLATYFEDLDAAWERVTAHHDRVVLSGHSTGGLVVALWADSRRPAELAGLVLNSPWLDLQGKPWLRSPVADFALDKLGTLQPLRELERDVTGFYARSLHRDHEGEWAFDLAWKPLESFPVRYGWLRAIRRGHAQVRAGLDVPAPVLVLSSDRSAWPTEMNEDVFRCDIVLDVAHIRRWATAIGHHVTYAAVPGAQHDVVLSRPEPRALAYEEIQRWTHAYLT